MGGEEYLALYGPSALAVRLEGGLCEACRKKAMKAERKAAKAAAKAAEKKEEPAGAKKEGEA